MTICVAVLADVPAQAQCLATALPSLGRLGEVVVFNADGGAELSAEARRLGVGVIELQWQPDYSAMFNAMLARTGDGPRIIAYADETVEALGEDAALASREGPAAVAVRHRTGERDTYPEENETRYCGGDGLSFTGLVGPEAVVGGERVAADDLPHTGIVLEHYPVRWPGLAEQRVARSASVYRAALATRPDDADLVYALFRTHVSLHDWASVGEAAARWHALAGEHDERRPLVHYHEACAAVTVGDRAGAAALARAAVEQAPRFADAWYLIGELHAAAHDDADADAAFARAAELGATAEPLAVEDRSLATWRPLQARAALARRAGQADRARELLDSAKLARARLRAAG